MVYNKKDFLVIEAEKSEKNYWKDYQVNAY